MNRIVFSARWKYATAIILLLLLGLKFRFALVSAVCLIFALLLNYLILREIAGKTSLKSENVKAVTEKEVARLFLTFRNLSYFSLNNFLLTFDFAGSVSASHKNAISADIPSGGIFRTGIYLVCDNGMGIFEAKNFNIAISDIFEIFKFTVHFDLCEAVEVRPKIEELPAVLTRGSRYSELYGLHEIQSRGLSVNFSNLRPYNFGDSVRHIAWRQSARHGTLIVKEFERMVNTDATVILNLNPALHVGLANLNTWETAKDVGLSLTSQLLSSGSSVEFIYNYGAIPKATGKEQFYAIAKALIEHDMLKSAEGLHQKRVHIDDPFGNSAARVIPGSTLIYITPVNYPHLRDSLQSLTWLSRENVEVILVLINPLTIWPEFRAVDSSIQDFEKTDKINQLLAELQSHSVRVYFADMGGPLADQFREKPKLSENLVLPKFSRHPEARK